MPIRQDDNQPNRRFGIVNIILIGVGALLLFSSLFPNKNMQIHRVPYLGICIFWLGKRLLNRSNAPTPIKMIFTIPKRLLGWLSSCLIGIVVNNLNLIIN